MEVVRLGDEGIGSGWEGGTSGADDVAFELMNVFVEDEGNLAPAVAVMMLKVLEETVVEAGWGLADIHFFVLVLREAPEGTAGGEGFGGESGDANGGVVVVADGGVDGGFDFMEGALHLEFALGDEFLEDGGATTSSGVGVLDVFFEVVESFAGEVEGGEEFGLACAGVGNGSGDVAFEGGETAFGQEAFGIGPGAAGEVGAFGGDGEEGEVTSEALLGELAHVVGDDLDFLGGAEVALLEDKDDVAHPLAMDFFEELPGGGAPGVGGREDEDDEVGDGDEAFGDLLVLVLDGVGAGGVDDMEVAEEVAGDMDFVERGGDGNRGDGVAVFEEEDLLGGGDDAGAGEFLAEKSVEEGGLADIDLADDDEDEGLFEGGLDVVEQEEGVEIGGVIFSLGAQVLDDGGELGPELEVVVADHSSGEGIERRPEGGALPVACTSKAIFRSLREGLRIRADDVSGADEDTDGHGGLLDVHELADGDEAVAFGEDLIERAGHGVDGGRVDVVDEEDGAGADAIDEAAGDDGDAGAAPVLGVDTPHDGGVAELSEDEVFDASVDGAIWGADGLRAITGGLVNRVSGHFQFFADLVIGHAGEAAVGPGVVADFVAFGDDLANQGGVGFGVFADEEEGAFDVAVAKDFEETGSVRGVGAVVESHGGDQLIRLDGGIGEASAGRGDGGHVGRLIEAAGHGIWPGLSGCGRRGSDGDGGWGLDLAGVGWWGRFSGNRATGLGAHHDAKPDA